MKYKIKNIKVKEKIKPNYKGYHIHIGSEAPTEKGEKTNYWAFVTGGKLVKDFAESSVTFTTRRDALNDGKRIVNKLISEK